MNTWTLDFYHQSDNSKKKLQNSLNFVWRSRPRERQTKFCEFCNLFFGITKKNVVNFANSFMNCHSDGKNLGSMSSFGRDFILKLKFLFLFKQSRFYKASF